METLRTEAETKLATEQHLPGHRPEIQRLTIALDTANALFSGGDAESHEAIT
jgi:hypothetical protein